MNHIVRMSTKVRKCCVMNCKDTVSKRHRFPFVNTNLFKEWIKAIDHPRFASLTFIQIYRSYYVCSRHFTEQCIVPTAKRGLTFNAVPTLHMHDNETTIVSVSAKVAIADHNYALPSLHDRIFIECNNKPKSNSTSTTCRMCLIDIREEIGMQSINDDFEFYSSLLDFLPEIDLNLTQDPVVCTQCTIMIAQINQFKQLCMRTESILKNRCVQSSPNDKLPYIKEEIFAEDIIEEEFFENAIKTEDGYVLINADMPPCIEKPISENVFYHCHQCNYVTNDKNYLTVHVFSHRLKCDKCGYVARDDSSFAIHKETHLRIWRCNVCSYKCEEIHALNEHMDTHSGADLFADKADHQKSLFENYDAGCSDEEIDVVSVDDNQNGQSNLALVRSTTMDHRTRRRCHKRKTSSCDKQQENSSDSETPIGRRSLRNDMEKQRRDELRCAFEDLRLMVPEIRGREKEGTAKVHILNEATFYCYELEDSSASMKKMVQMLRNKQDFLKARVHELQKELAARY